MPTFIFNPFSEHNFRLLTFLCVALQRHTVLVTYIEKKAGVVGWWMLLEGNKTRATSKYRNSIIFHISPSTAAAAAAAAAAALFSVARFPSPPSEFQGASERKTRTI
jgi:hypothetical protein